jgi:hypothetical protein
VNTPHLTNSIKKILCGFACGVALLICQAQNQPPSAPNPNAAIPIMPLSEVKSGMKGCWKTVISGTQISKFELELIDIVGNHAGPQSPVIFAKALDQSQIQTGPVSGMSGSPVYIDGKLVGAYAHGFDWEKNQAILGITPIEEMLKMLKYPDEEAFARGTWSSESESNNSTQGASSFCTNLSEEVLNVFASDWKSMGIRPMSVPAGGAIMDTSVKLASPPEIVPGSSVIAVLMDGDFNSGAAGTITWRSEDRVLGFGHSHKGTGPTAIPMAVGEIVAVINQYDASFKFAKFGPVIGMLTQDRHVGMVGILGKFAPTTALEFIIHPEMGPTKIYRSRLSWSQEFGPTLAGGAVLQSIHSTLDAGKQQTYWLKTQWEIEGFPMIETMEIFADAKDLSKSVRNDFRALLCNSFSPAHINRVSFEIQTQPCIRKTKLVQLEISPTIVHPGEKVSVHLVFQRENASLVRNVVEIRIPTLVQGALEIAVVDAESAYKTIWGNNAVKRKDFSSLADVVKAIQAHLPSDRAYIQLRQKLPGLRANGMNFPALPQSIAQRYKSSQEDETAMHNIVLWEFTIPLESVFEGEHLKMLNLKM